MMAPAASARLTLPSRKLILDYTSKGYSTVKVTRVLKEKHGIITSRQSVRLFLLRFKKTGSLRDTDVGRSRQNAKRTSFLLTLINLWLSQNNEMTSAAICHKFLTMFGMRVSSDYVCRLRKRLGWTARRIKYCQLISHKNKHKRLGYALDCLNNEEKFENVIFVDETTVEMRSNGRLFFFKKGSDLQKIPARKQKPKHSYKVHVWGGISYRGRTDICVFTGIMDSIIYQGILKDCFLPFTNAVFPDGYRLYQDNDSKHKSKSTQEWMKRHNMLDKVMEVPASSPDLNPIENVWADLKQYLENFVKPKKKDELVKGIVDFWSSLSSDNCGYFIDHLHKVMPAVVINEVGPSGY